VQGAEDEADNNARNIDSSLGILSQSEMMHSFGIIEDIGSSLSTALADDETSELAQLKRAYDKLVGEKASLQKQVVSLEDLYTQTQEESQAIQNRLRLIQNSVDSCHHIHAEFEDLKSAKFQTEEKFSILKEDLSSVEAKLKQLCEQNDALQAKLSASEQALTLARQNETDAICLGDQRAKEVEKMTAQVEEKVAENEKLHEELDQAVQELQAAKVENQQLANDVENLLSDISSKEMQLKDARINNSNKILRGLDDISFEVSGLGEPWSNFDGNSSELAAGAPSAISTPFSK
jgi:chromosome segregation ATPase